MHFLKYFLLLVTFFSTSFAKEFSIMTYNVENLFNTLHDNGKEDFSYLPKKIKDNSPLVQRYCNGLGNKYYRKTCLELDWNRKTVVKKLNNIVKVLLSYDRGQGADILVLQEVENKDVLNQLLDHGLRRVGYKHIGFVEGPDSRGIDVAVISKYPITQTKYHNIDIEGRTTRGILETHIALEYKRNNYSCHKKAVVFSNHWPSQANSDETRIKASEVLINAAKAVWGNVVIAAGDFNTVKDDKRNGITENVLPYFVDVETLGRKFSRNRRFLKKGTHWYKKTWDSLDRIFVMKDVGYYKVDYSSFDIVARKFMFKEIDWVVRETGEIEKHIVPARFDSKELTGFSDHLPVAVKIRI